MARSASSPLGDEGTRAEPSATGTLVDLGGDWSLWSRCALRVAGLPAERALDFAGRGPGHGFATPDEEKEALRRAALDPWFREAVTWQNRPLVERWLARAGAAVVGEHGLSRLRARETTVALYLQRYATKNDTIGFFGPISWGTLSPGQSAPVVLRQRAVSRRRVYFEPWAVEALARRLESDPAVRRQLKPRRNPSDAFVGRSVVLPNGRTTELEPADAAVVAACDGRLTAAQVVACLAWAGDGSGTADVERRLDSLVRRGYLLWEFDLPLDERMAERLLEQVEAIADRDALERHAGPLRNLLRRARELEQAGGDPELVHARLVALEREFERAAAAPAARPKPSAPTGRALIWHDVQTSGGVSVGGDALAALAEPLALVLDSCRWLTWRIARGLEERLASLVAAEPGLPLVQVVRALSPEIEGRPGSVVAATLRELQDRVGGLLQVGTGEADVAVSIDAIAHDWQTCFAAPGPGWRAATLHSPDILLAAADVDAIERGEFLWVLGEMHPAANTLENRTRIVHQETPGEIERLVVESIRGRRFVPAFPRFWPEISARTYPPLTVDLSDRYVYVALAGRDTLPAHTPRVPAATLVVEPDEGRGPVVVSTCDPELRAPLVEVVGELLSFAVVRSFRLFPPDRDLPRVTLGKLVVQRRSWRVGSAELASALASRRPEPELAAALRDRGVARHTFAVLPGEPKPLFCDTRNAPLLRALARRLRRLPSGATARFDEMLPGFEELWLQDASGSHYTNELRLVAVDGREPAR